MLFEIEEKIKVYEEKVKIFEDMKLGLKAMKSVKRAERVLKGRRN
jgi:hypothetical protein